MKPSTARCLARLRGGEWVSGNQLFEVAGTRYGARLFELRTDYGFVIEKRPAPPSAVPLYRIVEADEQLTLERVAS